MVTCCWLAGHVSMVKTNVWPQDPDPRPAFWLPNVYNPKGTLPKARIGFSSILNYSVRGL